MKQIQPIQPIKRSFNFACSGTERSDLLENAVTDAILDMKLGLAIEEGDTGAYATDEIAIWLNR
jgi:hypothetical protein